MATPASLAIRRAEAEKRIAAHIQTLGQRRGFNFEDTLNLSHRDPAILDLMKIEAMAEALGKIADREPRQVQEQGRDAATADPRARPALSAANVTLRQAILDATDDALIAIPGIGEKSVASLREWAGNSPGAEPEPPQEEAEPRRGARPLVTVETVEEKPLETTETVEVKPAEEVNVADTGEST